MVLLVRRSRIGEAPYFMSFEPETRSRGPCKARRREFRRASRTHEHAPGAPPVGPPTQDYRRVANLLGFLLAIVAGTAFNESRQRLDLKSKVPCTLALAVVTRT